MKPLVLVTNRLDSSLLARLPQIQEAQVCYVRDLFADANRLKEATGIILRSGTTIDKDLLDKTPSLKYIVTATAGFDHIDLKESKMRDVQVYHVPEAQSIAAAELTLNLIFATQRKWTQANKQISRGQWDRSLLLGRQVSGQKLGIIGYGRVGSLVAKMAQAFGLEVYGYDPFLAENPVEIKMLGFEELMRTVDIVSLHVPKTKLTRHMIKRETLEWMDGEATLINMARGDVINEADLITHLLENPNFRAGLDVFAKESLAIKSPLLSFSNVVLTPHIGASTAEALRRSSQGALDKMLKLLRGEPNVEAQLPPEALWWED